MVAECIETAEQADAARELGVDLGQGWFFGRPQEREQHPRRSPAVSGKRTSPLHEGIHLDAAAPAVPV